jgi:uncharacterized protein YdaU (DUF1376 family)
MKFNVPDFMSETMGWDDELVGLYIKLICYQWVKGQVPPPELLSRISPRPVERWAELEDLFPDGMCEWVENTRQEAISLTDARRRGGRKRAEQLARDRKRGNDNE